MAQVITVVSVARDGETYTGTIGLPVSRILRIRPAAASEIASFSTAVSAIEAEYIYGNSRRVSTFLSATAVATIITATNA